MAVPYLEREGRCGRIVALVTAAGCRDKASRCRERGGTDGAYGARPARNFVGVDRRSGAVVAHTLCRVPGRQVDGVGMEAP
jgi:hypothetical protein